MLDDQPLTMAGGSMYLSKGNDAELKEADSPNTWDYHLPIIYIKPKIQRIDVIGRGQANGLAIDDFRKSFVPSGAAEIKVIVSCRDSAKKNPGPFNVTVSQKKGSRMQIATEGNWGDLRRFLPLTKSLFRHPVTTIQIIGVQIDGVEGGPLKFAVLKGNISVMIHYGTRDEKGLFSFAGQLVDSKP